MGNTDLTTIQIDVETREKLRALASANERTSAGHLRWLVNQDFEKLQVVKLEGVAIPAKIENKKKEKA